MLRDLFDAPARGSKGEGRQEVIGTKAEGQRLHQVHIVQFCIHKTPNMQLREQTIREWIFIIQMLIQCRKNIEKSHDSEISHERGALTNN